jgi:hypothetical protein
MESGAVETTTDESSQLCQACGLCCSGLLFGHVELHGDEVGWAEARRLPIVRTSGDESGKVVLPQPCACLTSSGACAEYDDRPGDCRRYVCALLANVRAKGTTLATALERVAGARKIAADLRAKLPADEKVPVSRLWSLAERAGNGVTKDPDALLQVIGLERYIAKYFR